MANYHYDETGNMAAYFVITFLAFVLVPLTLSISPSKKKDITGCQCQPCQQQRETIAKREAGSLLNPKFTKKSMVLVSGWSLFAFLCWKVSNAKTDNKLYNPFEILGISEDTPEKEIKSTFKKLSKLYHPDKVKATANQTIEAIQNHFVDLTKAYKSLTDPVIRENWLKYNDPDGRQELSMGIALPKWVIEGRNNIWVLGFYGLVFGGALPALVGRWWFGSRQKTKDGINTLSAAAFFKSLREDSSIHEVVGSLGKAYQWEHPVKKQKVGADELKGLEKAIKERAGAKWETVRQAVGFEDAGKRRALVLLYAYLLRIPVETPELKKEQTEVLLQTPTLLNALLSVSAARNWLHTSLSIMRLHAYIAQALLPASGTGSSRLRFAQLPGIKSEEVQLGGGLAPDVKDLDDFVLALEKSGDERVTDVKKAAAKWPRLEIVDLSFKVIGERIVTPSSIVYLVVKLRLSPPSSDSDAKTEKQELDAEETKKSIKANEEKDNEFLTGRNDVEPLSDEGSVAFAHAPYWPGTRKPSWWLVVSDEKNNRLAVPPMKLSDVPFYDTHTDNDRAYRSYKLQFQAPPATQLLQWKVYFVSDTFIGDEVTKNIVLKVEDLSALTADEQQSEDEISDPEEDSLAGQMAAMRGGKVKKIKDEDQESDEESSTDDDQEDEDDSSSDSD